MLPLVGELVGYVIALRRKWSLLGDGTRLSRLESGARVLSARSLRGCKLEKVGHAGWLCGAARWIPPSPTPAAGCSRCCVPSGLPDGGFLQGIASPPPLAVVSEEVGDAQWRCWPGLCQTLVLGASTEEIAASGGALLVWFVLKCRPWGATSEGENDGRAACSPPFPGAVIR